MRIDDFRSNAPASALLDDEIIEKVKARRANATQIGGSHYKDMGVEPWDVVDTWPIDQRIGYYRGNALKYIMRMGSKGSLVEDAEKACHYIDKLLEVLG